MGWRWALTRSWALIRINTVSVACEKNPTFRDSTTGFCERRLEFILMTVLPFANFNQSETLPIPDLGTVASSEEISALVPRSSKQAVSSQNVSCFLR